jgi:hypothetical protein|tara:strand:+ start:787 stop:1029 length:243 start_codon:yes stop_codon:yes gene_type:complete
MSGKYSGWTNYATWRINSEILSDVEFTEAVTYEQIEDLVERIVFSEFDMNMGSHLIEDYARAFISEVNFYEIVDVINSDL